MKTAIFSRDSDVITLHTVHVRYSVTGKYYNELEFYGTHTRCTVCCMKLCETQLIAEEDYKFARTHTFALLTMVIALRTIKHL